MFLPQLKTMLPPLAKASFRLGYWGRSQGHVQFLLSHLTLTLVLNLTLSPSISLVPISPGGWIARNTWTEGTVVPSWKTDSGSSRHPQKLPKRQTHLWTPAISSWHPTGDHGGTRQIRLCHSPLLPSFSPPKPEGSKTTGSFEEMTLTFPWILGFHAWVRPKVGEGRRLTWIGMWSLD